LRTRIRYAVLYTASELHQHKIKQRRPDYVASRIIRIDKKAPSPFAAAML
jgi:hypothetical protein